MANEEDDGGGMDLLAVLREETGQEKDEQEEDGKGLDGNDSTTGKQQQEQHQHYYLRSTESTVVIRQVPSQGLSFQLWPAASSLVSILDQNPSLLLPHPTLRILELGSGTGLVGIAAASILGAHVTLTDLPHVLSNLHFNALSNAQSISSRGGSVDVRQLRWGDHEADSASLDGGGHGAFDVVLASDVVYYDHLFDPLLQTLGFFVRGEVTFLMAHLRRWKKRDSVFFRKARKLFDVAVVHTDPPLPGSRTGVVIYRFTAKV